MAGQRARPIEEDLMQNPFLRVLRASYEGLYKRAAERGESTLLLVPCAECLESENFSQIFAETHVLQASRVPGCFSNLCGQGLEVKETSVSTQLGFAEHRVCEVLQTESMYDFGNTFRVLVTDRPLIGKYRALPGAADLAPAGLKAAAPGGGPGAVAGGVALPGAEGEMAAGDLPAEWLNTAPAIQDALFDEVDRFRKTFVQVPGCEQSTAERIREIVSDATRKLIKHHRLTQPSQHRQLDYHVSRNIYAALHSFVFPHLTRILASAEERLTKAIQSYTSVEELVAAIPGAQGRGLGQVDVSSCSDQLADIDHKITPHEKIVCIDEAHSALQRCVEENARAAAAGRQQEGSSSPMEITGDDVLSLFILAVHRSSLKQRLAHVAHVEMYLQGAAGRSGSSEAARFEEAGYAVSALQAALQFFLEERRPAARGSQRPTTNIFSSYLQPSGPGAGALEHEGDFDRAGMPSQGLARQARTQGSPQRF